IFSPDWSSDVCSSDLMSQSALAAEIAAGVNFWGWDESDVLVGVMGLQQVRDATLIRHAYVRPTHQGRGIGGALLDALASQVAGRSEERRVGKGWREVG